MQFLNKINLLLNNDSNTFRTVLFLNMLLKKRLCEVKKE